MGFLKKLAKAYNEGRKKATERKIKREAAVKAKSKAKMEAALKGKPAAQKKQAPPPPPQAAKPVAVTPK